MLGHLGHMLVSLADSIMIGQLGTIPLAAAAFANSIFVIPMVFGIGIAYGITTNVANADGKNQAQKAGDFLKHGLFINSIAALLIFILLLGVTQLLPYLGQDTQVVALSKNYFLLISSSIFPFLVYLSFKQFAEGLSDTRTAMLISLAANLLNVALNYVLIYGHWGFPKMGIEGAGIATFVSRIIMAIALGWYLVKAKKFTKHLGHLSWGNWQKKYFLKILKIGVPSGLQYIFEISAFAVSAIIVGIISAKALAAHQIAISLASLSYMAASGLGAAATVRVANQIGKKDYLVMRNAGRSNMLMAAVFMLVCGFLFYFGKDYFPTWYTQDFSVQEIAAQLLVIAVLFQLSDGVQVVALGALRGMGEVKIPTFITFVAYWLLGLVPAYIMGIQLNWGAKGVWYGLALGLTAAAVFLYWRFEWKSKKMIHEKLG